VNFPALKNWQVKAHQDITFLIFPDQSEVKLILENFKVNFDTGLVLDKNGYFDFELKSCIIDFGNSYFYHDNFIVEFLMHEIIYFGIVVIENSVFYLGD
jgi:hypothetical protein